MRKGGGEREREGERVCEKRETCLPHLMYQLLKLSPRDSRKASGAVKVRSALINPTLSCRVSPSRPCRCAVNKRVIFIKM